MKLHTLLDVRGSIASFIHISNGKTHDVNALNELLPEAGAFYLLDRGHMYFARLHTLHEAGAFFLIRAQRALRVKRRYSHPVDRINTRVICDQTVTLKVFYSKQGYPTVLRRVVVRNNDGERTVFLTNDMQLPPQVVGKLYRFRGLAERGSAMGATRESLKELAACLGLLDTKAVHIAINRLYRDLCSSVADDFFAADAVRPSTAGSGAVTIASLDELIHHP